MHCQQKSWGSSIIAHCLQTIGSIRSLLFIAKTDSCSSQKRKRNNTCSCSSTIFLAVAYSVCSGLSVISHCSGRGQDNLQVAACQSSLSHEHSPPGDQRGGKAAIGALAKRQALAALDDGPCTVKCPRKTMPGQCDCPEGSCMHGACTCEVELGSYSTRKICKGVNAVASVDLQQRAACFPLNNSCACMHARWQPL